MAWPPLRDSELAAMGVHEEAGIGAIRSVWSRDDSRENPTPVIPQLTRQPAVSA